jgi:copper homeostasis protein
MQYHNDHILLSDVPGDEETTDVTSVDRVKKLIELANGN